MEKMAPDPDYGYYYGGVFLVFLILILLLLGSGRRIW